MMGNQKRNITDRILVYGLILSVLFAGRTIFSPSFILTNAFLSLAGLSLAYLIIRKSEKKIARFLNLVSDIAVILVVAKTGFTIVNSPFVFENVVFFFAEGIFLMIAAMSFNCRGRRILTYIKVLTLLVFMSYPVLFAPAGNFPRASIMVYVFIWILLLRFGCQNFSLGKPEKILLTGFYCLLFLLLSLLITDFLGKNIVFPKLEYNQAFIFTQKFKAEDKLYLLQNSLLGECMGNKVSDNRRRDMFLFLPKLFKKSPWVMEVEKARTGLIDPLRRPGPGIENRGRRVIFRLIKQYTEAKIDFKKASLAAEIIETADKASISLRGKFAIASGVSSLYRSKSPKDVETEAKALKESISAYVRQKKVKKKLNQKSDELIKWSLYSAYNNARKKIEPEDLSELEKVSAGQDSFRAQVESLRRRIEQSKDVSELLQLSEEITGIASPAETREENEEAKKALEDMAELKMKISLIEEPQRAGKEEETKGGLRARESKKAVSAGEEKQAELKKIEVRPETAEINLGQDLRFEARGIYSDGSRSDITSEVEWESSDLPTAAVKEGQLVAFRKGETIIRALSQNIESNHVRVVIKPPRLVSIKVSPLQVSLPRGDNFSLTAKGYYADGSRKDITDLVQWHASGGAVKSESEGGAFGAVSVGEAEIYCQLQQTKSESVQVEVFTPFIERMLKVLFFILSLLIFVFLTAYLRLKIRSFRLKKNLSLNPAKFIMQIYENMLVVVSNSGPKYKRTISYRKYASLIHQHFDPSGDVFSRLSRDFCRAKYSSHPVAGRDAEIFFTAYNSGMAIASRHISFFRRFLLFLRGIPIFI